MREQGYFVNDAVIAKLECARDYLVEMNDKLTNILMELEELPDEEYKPRRNEYRAISEAHSRIDYALDHIDKAFSALRKA